MVEDSETNIGINIGNNPTTELRNNWKDHTLEKRNKVHHYFYIRPVSYSKVVPFIPTKARYLFSPMRLDAYLSNLRFVTPYL